MNWFNNIANWINKLFSNWFNPVFQFCIVEESLPPKLQKRVLYLVQEDGFAEQAAMLCPCGKGHSLHMNLIPDEHPYWTLQQHEDGTASLHPSVWRKKDCRSHFWFKRGKVYWCDNKNNLSDFLNC